MSTTLIWLHDEALRGNHPVFKAAGNNARTIFIWDDEAFKQQGYSLKRLVFVYEALCALPVDIIKGDSTAVLKELAPEKLFIPATKHAYIKQLAKQLGDKITIEFIENTPFVDLPNGYEFKRFFKYWNKTKKNAFKAAGGGL